MPKFFVKNEQINENFIFIVGSDVNHIQKVLRLSINDEINVCNVDKQENYRAKIIESETEAVKCKIVNVLESVAESNVDITIFQGIPKTEKMELIIQKSVELGAKAIIPVEMERSIIRLTEKDKQKKLQRWQTISEVAAKQSGRDCIPKVENCMKLMDVLNILDEYDILLVAYENETKNTLKDELTVLKKSKKQQFKIGVLIGPEGRFRYKRSGIIEK